MIAAAKQDGSGVRAYDENGFEIFFQYGELLGFTGSTVTIKDNGTVKVYDEKGSFKFNI